MNSTSAQKILQSGAGPLSRLMNLSDAPAVNWRAQDLAAMLRHQLAAPLAFDLQQVTVNEAEIQSLDKALQEGRKLGIKSFQDLFNHPDPPLKLLLPVKNLFKRQSGAASERRPEQQVAYVLYLLTILMAKTRWSRSITKLGDDAVSRSAQWALSQDWVDTATKSLLTQALQVPKHLAYPSKP